MDNTIIIKNKKELARVAALLTQEIPRTRRTGAFVLALSGELGAGKTTFVQSLARALGVDERITSPTFVIFKQFSIKKPPFTLFAHIDCYRLKEHATAELTALGLPKLIEDDAAIIVIEWAEYIKRLIPKDALWITLEHGSTEHQRILHLNTQAP